MSEFLNTLYGNQGDSVRYVADSDSARTSDHVIVGDVSTKNITLTIPAPIAFAGRLLCIKASPGTYQVVLTGGYAGAVGASATVILYSTGYEYIQLATV